ncbi:MAG: hypothetical protein CVV37_01670 [Nitrospira bacterium HGW-Nitrospira-1]|nr:MAG: hypothetical protein CVV37_01670 [Nitrospira bacterium HGW-Nitrospira-1]
MSYYTQDVPSCKIAAANPIAKGKRQSRKIHLKNPAPRAQGVKSQNKFILSFSGLTPASSMPSDLIRGWEGIGQ